MNNNYIKLTNNLENLNLIKIKDEFLKLENDDRQAYFYNIRKEYNSYRIAENKLSIKRAVEFIFLNRTCFNGLYRVNKNGVMKEIFR